MGYGSRSDEEMRRFLETIASLPDTKRADRLLKRRARKTDAGAFILERDRIVRDLIKQAQATPRRHSLRRPLWPGFAVNTIFYATFLWLLICGPFALRRFIRMKRGRCPACAYPRGESNVCSECGKALPGRARATQVAVFPGHILPFHFSTLLCKPPAWWRDRRAA